MPIKCFQNNRRLSFQGDAQHFQPYIEEKTTRLLAAAVVGNSLSARKTSKIIKLKNKITTMLRQKSQFCVTKKALSEKSARHK